MRACLRSMTWLVWLLACVVLPRAAEAQQKKSVTADWQWLHSKATAMFVLEPPPLAGVKRWGIDSPRHRGPIHAMAVAPAGGRVATAGADGLVRIWNLETGQFEKAFAGHRYHTHQLAWSPDSQQLASHSWSDATTRVWDPESGALRKEFSVKTHFWSIAWSPDSRRLAGVTHGSGKIYISDALAEPQVLVEMGQPIRFVTWSRDGTQLGVSYGNNDVTVVDASGGKQLFQLAETAAPAVTAIEWSPDGKRIATASAAAAAIWEAADGKAVQKITGPCTDVAWSPDGTQVVTAYTTACRVCTVADGKEAARLPQAATLVTWNAKTGKIVLVGPDQISIWPAAGGKADRTIDAGGSAAPIFQAGKPLITGVGRSELSLWDPFTLKRIGRLAHDKPVTTAAWSFDGKHFASATDDGTLRLWDVGKQEELHALSGHKGRVLRLEWSPKADALASAGADKTVRLWKSDGSSLGVLEGHTAAVRALAWSPSGTQLASGGTDEQVIVWDARKLVEQRKIPGSMPVTALAWATVAGQPAIACGYSDASINVVNAASGEMLSMVFKGHANSWYQANALAWMPGKQPRLLSGIHYMTQVWDAAQAETQQRQIIPGGATDVFATAGGSLAVARSNDRTVRFWDPVGGTLRGVILEEGDAIAAISTTGDVKFHKDEDPKLIAIVETDEGQKTIPLAELAKLHGWKNNAKVLKLPTKN